MMKPQYHHGNGEATKRENKKMKSLRIVLLLISIAFVSNTYGQNVYVTKTGEKYHTEPCRYLKYSKKEITLQKAFEGSIQ